jgi:hypothetical protein
MRYALGFDTYAFRQEVSEIFEDDYGNFMRAANKCLRHLQNELHVLKDKNIDRRLYKMKMYLLFNPNWDIESTRELLAADTKYLDDLLQGHNQDWESASSSYNFVES